MIKNVAHGLFNMIKSKWKHRPKKKKINVSPKFLIVFCIHRDGKNLILDKFYPQ